MDCKEFMHNIPAFLKKELDYEPLKQFCEHTKHCEQCKEELTIQFLVSEGISHLEAGDAFDLNKELNARMAGCNQKLKTYETSRFRAFCLQAVGFWFLIASVVVLFI